MSNFHSLIGLPYIDGRQDCYSVVRNYYSMEWGIELPNYARPERFWEDPELDLYSLYKHTGFEPVVDNHNYEVGDAVLMPVLSAMNNHAGVIVDDNQILHHLPDQLSLVDPLRPKWANRVTVHLRHPKITEARKASVEVVHLHEVIDADVLRNPRVQEEIGRALGSQRGAVRSDHAGDGDRPQGEPVTGA